MKALHEQILKLTQAIEIIDTESVQTLWSGYGEIKRYYLKGGKVPSVIVKHIRWPDENNHPRGWNTEISHQRKLQSYQVERNWYLHFSEQTNQSCKVPEIYQTFDQDKELFLIMEDLDASGYPVRLYPESISVQDVKQCLSWLAHFHAKFMGQSPEGLWLKGTYWHLETRPDEWERMNNIPLKNAARAIDKKLEDAQFQTFVHGDAKLANFCFSENEAVAAVDFQYIGKGCGMKDLAYLLSSCFDDEACRQYEKELLEYYFVQLEKNLDKSIDYQSLKIEWSALYKYAWADFYRFLDGWSPGHWKMHGYSAQLTTAAIEELQK